MRDLYIYISISLSFSTGVDGVDGFDCLNNRCQWGGGVDDG